MKDLLIISAAEFETRPLVEFLKKFSIPFESYFCGVGAVKSAQNAHQLHQKCKDRDCIFIGSAGIFDLFDAPRIYRIKEVHWACLSLRLGQSYIVKGDLCPVDLSTKLPPWASELHNQAICISAASISLTDHREYDLNAVLKMPRVKETPRRVFLENIELYSVALPIVTAAKSFVAILATTNEVGSNAHESWLKNYENASKTIAKELSHVLPWNSK